MFEKRVIPGKTYCIFAPGPITVTAIMNNIEVKIVDATEVGKYFFTAPTTKIYSSINPNCIFEPDNSLNYNIGNTPNWLYSLKAALKILLGNSTAKITLYDNKLTIAASLDTTNEQIEEAKSLLTCILPRNVVTEMEWADGLPIAYTRLEYLETAKGYSYINTGLLFATGYIKVRISSQVDPNPDDKDYYTSVNKYVTGIIHPGYTGVDVEKNFLVYQETPEILTVDVSGIRNKYFDNRVPEVATVIIDTENGYAEVNGDRRSYTPFVQEETVAALPIFARQAWYSLTDLRYQAAFAHTRVHSFEVTAKSNGNVQCGKFIPALDPITKQPGMYDTINKVFKVNAGTGDFTYPGMENQVTTYSLRNRMYGKITEHGIRRLYCIPEGYNSKEEYAEQNGFKLLVETPMPEEGYWTPVWHDREDCIELEWVETEPANESSV